MSCDLLLTFRHLKIPSSHSPSKLPLCRGQTLVSPAWRLLSLFPGIYLPQACAFTCSSPPHLYIQLLLNLFSSSFIPAPSQNLRYLFVFLYLKSLVPRCPGVCSPLKLSQATVPPLLHQPPTWYPKYAHIPIMLRVRPNRNQSFQQARVLQASSILSFRPEGGTRNWVASFWPCHAVLERAKASKNDTKSPNVLSVAFS